MKDEKVLFVPFYHIEDYKHVAPFTYPKGGGKRNGLTCFLIPHTGGFPMVRIVTHVAAPPGRTTATTRHESMGTMERHLLNMGIATT